MLANIYIKNIAVIEKTDVDFTDGFNILTGETGAGKSIIIDAINAVLGQRTSKELIRTGADSALVCATFCDLSEENKQTVANAGYELDEDGSLILQREISATGRNICRINGMPANVSTLREIAGNLITIHGQHESYELLSPNLHINYLDNIGNLHAMLEDYKEVYHRYKEIESKLYKGKNDESERLRRIDLLRYQIKEIDDAELEDGETDELEAEKKVLLNSEKINDYIYEAHSLINGDEDNSGVLDALQQAAAAISAAAEYQPALSELSERLNTIYYDLDDAAEELSDSDEVSEFDPERLEEIEGRLDLIYHLSRKYGKEIPDILFTLENAKKELDELENYEANMEALTEEYKEISEKIHAVAAALSLKRSIAAKLFVEKVTRELQFLDMPNVRLCFDCQKTEPTEMGIDKIEMLISANPGEEPKPVSKIASGGELSRIMLAIKNVLADGDSVETMIFDEVDTGISGSASQKVGQKLKEAAQNRQVICITHQPQIAALADTHFLIKKQVKDNKSYTQVEKLDFDGRKLELARAMSGTSITELTLRHAEEMLLSAKNIM